MSTATTARERAGALLRATRDAQALTLAQVAERAGISRRTLQRYEAGEYAVSTEDVLPLALALTLDHDAAELFALALCGLTRAEAGTTRGAARRRAARAAEGARAQ